MKKIKNAQTNKFDPTRVKLNPLAPELKQEQNSKQERGFKNVFLAAGLSVIIHTGLFIGVYCQASEDTNFQHPVQAQIEIDLRLLKPAHTPKNADNSSVGAIETARFAEAGKARRPEVLPKARPKAQMETQMETQMEAKLEAGGEAKPKAKPEAEPKAGPAPQASGADPHFAASKALPGNVLPNSKNPQGQEAGGAIAAGNNSPKIINNPKPNYPALARQRGQEGLVLLIVQVDEKGQPGPIEIKTSSGYPMLDQAALKGIKKWKFQPASLAGLPMAGSVLVPVEFRLQD